VGGRCQSTFVAVARAEADVRVVDTILGCAKEVIDIGRLSCA